MSDYDIAALAAEGGLIPDDLDVFEDSDGDLYVLDPSDGTRYDVERPDDTEMMSPGLGDDDVDTHGIAVSMDLNPNEEALLDVFIEASDGDTVSGIEAYHEHQREIAAVQGVELDAEGPAEEAVAEWFKAHPAAAADVDEFYPYYEAAGEDLDAGYALYERHLDLMREAADKEGLTIGPKVSTEDAIADAYADGSLGTKSKSYRHKRGGYDTPLDDAMGSFMEELSAKNAAVNQRRVRIREMRRSGG